MRPLTAPRIIVLRSAVAGLILVAAAAFVLAPGGGEEARAQAAPAGPSSPFRNVKVLTDVTTKQEMRQRMREIAASLGVKCSHCHVPGEFHLDEKKPKLVARDMLRLVQDLNAGHFAEAEDKPAITCWTCHRGEEKPDGTVPRSAFDELDAQQ